MLDIATCELQFWRYWNMHSSRPQCTSAYTVLLLMIVHSVREVDSVLFLLLIHVLVLMIVYVKFKHCTPCTVTCGTGRDLDRYIYLSRHP